MNTDDGVDTLQTTSESFASAAKELKSILRSFGSDGQGHPFIDGDRPPKEKPTQDAPRQVACSKPSCDCECATSMDLKYSG